MPFSPEKRKAYDKARPKRTGYKRPSRQAPGSHVRKFVAIDSEGLSFGETKTIVMQGGVQAIDDRLKGIYVPPIPAIEKTYQDHRTFMWMACSESNEPDYIAKTHEPYLTSVDILLWLTALPTQYPNCIFVAFAFNYDVVQILRDLPHKVLWELHNEKYFSEKDDPTIKKHKFFNAYYQNYKIKYMKGKKLTVENLITKQRITIYDTFSYFQSTFLKACAGVIEPEAMALIAEGKKKRLNFNAAEDLPFALKYTEAECRALCQIMGRVRKGAQDMGIVPRAWYGPGSLASAAMRLHEVREHYYPMVATDLPDFQTWAHHAYFGGRIELLKMGTAPIVHNYDVKSAYPFNLTRLPSMKGGTWKYHENVSRETVRAMSILSMVHVKSSMPRQFAKANFAPLPYRMHTGEIRFPSVTHGIYCQEEICAALEYEDRQVEKGYRLKLMDAWEFIPANDERPFAFVNDYYDLRVTIPKTNGQNQVIKLIINSLYGKAAQAVGSDVPKDACIWYAAAITAGTRAQLLRGAMQAPDDCVMFATDGLYTLKPLDLDIGGSLGTWDYEEIPAGGIFVKSGIYTNRKTDKARGIKPDFLKMPVSEWISTKIVSGWKRKEITTDYKYVHYVTLGMALASEKLYPALGQWVHGERNILIDEIGKKRCMKPGKPWKELVRSVPNGISRENNKSAFELLKSFANGDEIPDGGKYDLPLSYRHQPEWLDPIAGEAARNERDQEDIMRSLAYD